MLINELLLKTAFCCMACDGEIADEELNLIKTQAVKTSTFGDIDLEKILNDYVSQINVAGGAFLSNYLDEVSSANLQESDELSLVKIAIEMIEADNDIEYSEIKFFKEIRERLKISDDAILAELPDKEDYLLPDVKRAMPLESLNFSFNSIPLIS